MRWTVRIGVALALLLGAYMAWPFVDLFRLAQAVETRSLSRLERGIDVSAVARSVTRQVLDTYLVLTGKDARVAGATRDLVVGAVAAAAQPALMDAAAPERLLDLLNKGWPPAARSGGPDGRLLLTPRSLGDLWRIFAASDYGIREFITWVPPNVGRKERFGLRLRLVKWRWRLYAVELPEALRVRLATEMIEAPKRRRQP